MSWSFPIFIFIRLSFPMSCAFVWRHRLAFSPIPFRLMYEDSVVREAHDSTSAYCGVGCMCSGLMFAAGNGWTMDGSGNGRCLTTVQNVQSRSVCLSYTLLVRVLHVTIYLHSHRFSSCHLVQSCPQPGMPPVQPHPNG